MPINPRTGADIITKVEGASDGPLEALVFPFFFFCVARNNATESTLVLIKAREYPPHCFRARSAIYTRPATLSRRVFLTRFSFFFFTLHHSNPVRYVVASLCCFQTSARAHAIIICSLLNLKYRSLEKSRRSRRLRSPSAVYIYIYILASTIKLDECNCLTEEMCVIENTFIVSMVLWRIINKKGIEGIKISDSEGRSYRKR